MEEFEQIRYFRVGKAKIIKNKKKMKRSNTQRATGNEIQRADFLSSLRTKLGQIATAHAKVYAAANDYLAQGFNQDETEELLLIDGFDKDVVASCINSLNNDDQPATTGKRWGFTVEDFYGRIVSHAELNASIVAETEDEAFEKAEQFISSADTENGMERVVDVFELE